MSYSRLLALAAAVFLAAAPADAAGLRDSLTKGTPDLKSAGPLAFGPEGVLFIGDPAGGAVFAVDTGDRGPAAKGSLNVEAVNEKVAALLGTTKDQILIRDLAVNPASATAYLSVGRGKGPKAAPVVVRVGTDGKPSELSLKDVPFAKVELPNPSSNKPTEAITGMAYIDGKLIVAGLSSEQFASTLRAIQVPFTKADKGTSVEIYHGAHGKLETASPVRTFAALDVGGEPTLLAAYTCTPLVKFPVSALQPGIKVRGTTVAELGNRNTPLDMVPYKKGGKDYVLVANTARGVMKVDLSGVDKAEGIGSRVAGTAGLKYETVEGLKGVKQLARLDADNALLLVEGQGGAMNLQTVALP